MKINACTVLFAVAVALVGVVSAEVNWPMVTQKCALAHQVPLEHIQMFFSYEFVRTLNAADNQKCYAKCLGDISGFLAGGGVVAEPYVEFAALRQHAEPHARAILAKCLTYTPVVNDCNSAFDMFVCLLNF